MNTTTTNDSASSPVPASSPPDHVLLTGGVDAGGAFVDLLADRTTGRIVERGPSLTSPEAEKIDCLGRVLLPAPAEPHAHLDKAYTSETVVSRSGDLSGAVEAWTSHWPEVEVGDVADRAIRGAIEAINAGCTAIRTHVDLSGASGLTSVRALIEVRETLRAHDVVDLQICALVQPPLGGPGGGAQRDLLEAALVAGIDVIGGLPSREPDVDGFFDVVFGLAAEFEVNIDLHVDEALHDEHSLDDLLDHVERRRPSHAVTASHCVSLGMVESERQVRTARRLAEADIAMITLPATNLFLQARGVTTAAPRGLTSLRALIDEDVVLAAGADNVRDAFNWVGRHDPVLTAGLLVVAGHLTVEESWQLVSSGAHRAIDREPGALAIGDRCDVLAIDGSSMIDSIGAGSPGRSVIRGGRLVADTATITRHHVLDGSAS